MGKFKVFKTFELWYEGKIVGYRAYNLANPFTEVYDVDRYTVLTLGLNLQPSKVRLHLESRGAALVSKSEELLGLHVQDISGNFDKVKLVFHIHSVPSNSRDGWRPWTPEEDRVLRKNYEGLTLLELTQLLPYRGRSSVNQRVKHLGLNVPNVYRWSKEEDEILRQYYEDTGPDGVLHLLPNRTRTSIKGEASKLGLRFNGNYTVNKIFFDTLTPESAWVLGWLVTDGHVSWKIKNRIEIVLDGKDLDVLYKIQKLLVLEGSCLKPLTGKNEGQYRFLLHDEHMYTTLVTKYNFGREKTKDYTINYPVPSNLLPHLLRGMYEGDGTIMNSNRGCSYLHFSLVGNIHVINFFRGIVTKHLGYVMGLNSVESGNMILYRTYWNGRDVEKLFNWLYKGTEEHLRMDRKFKVYREYLTLKE